MEEIGEGSEAVMMSCELKSLGSTQEIAKLLQCPICQGVPLPPIWNCELGHIACDQCKRQLNHCALCRAPFVGGRNYFMEAVVNECNITCPYAESGCTAVFKTHFMKTHASECKFGPKIKWIASQGPHGEGVPPLAVTGGNERGVKLYVIRAPHNGSLTPGKLFEYAPPGITLESNASLAWGGGERSKFMYEVLVAPPDHIKWIPSQNGVQVENAVMGGHSEAHETIYIGRFLYEGNLINGKIHPSHGCCYIGVDGEEIASTEYEILVKVDPPPSNESKERNPNNPNNETVRDDDAPAYYS